MELKQIKNPNAMTATEMAMILAGTGYKTGVTGGDKYNSSDAVISYCDDNGQWTKSNICLFQGNEDASEALCQLDCWRKEGDLNGYKYLGEI